MNCRHFTLALHSTSRLALFAVGLLVLAGGLPMRAQELPTSVAAAPAPVAAAKPMTLQEGLTQIAPVPSGVTLTVGPQWENLPQGSLPPEPSATPSDVASAFGKANPTFGDVMAIGPPTMTLLNPTPGVPNPFAGMSPYDIVPLFAATLTEAQWTSLTSETGLSIGALTETQRQLFDQMLPDGRLKVAPWFGDFNPTPSAERDLTDQLSSARLRLKQTAEVQISSEGQERGMYQMQHIPPTSSSVYKMLPSSQTQGSSQEMVYGQPVRAVVPNQLKAGDLEMAAGALQAQIPTGGLRTVGDLMARVSRLTHLELYADRRLEQKTLLILGTGKTASAEDLLKALAFCLTGVYRKVGPAYVLTDDTIGIATRMARWYEFEKTADALRQKPLQAARKALDARFGAKKLSGFGDPLALTDAQTKNTAGETPMSKLSETQQQAVRDAAALFEKSYESSIKAGVMQPLDLNAPVRLFPAVALQLVVSSLSEPVDMGVQVGRSSLFQPPTDADLPPEERHAQEAKEIRKMIAAQGDKLISAIRAQPAMWPQFAKQFPDIAAEILAAHPDLAAVVTRPRTAALKPADVLWRVPHRAALIAPQTAEEADADVAAAQALRLTQLWVQVFADGTTGKAGLTEVLKRVQEPAGKTKGTAAGPARKPLQVFAVLDLLSWGPKPPAAAQDLTVLEENSAEAQARHEKLLALQGKNTYDPDQDLDMMPGVVVTPFAPIVRTTLMGLVRSLADTPGLAGIVLRDTDPPGYDLRKNEEDTSSLLLGYAPDVRLAFLRAHHADPLDVFSPGRYHGKANTDLPNFRYDGQLSQSVSTEWNAYRSDSNVYFLRELRAAARPLRVIVQQRGRMVGGRTSDGTILRPPGWYAAWDSPTAPPPTLFGYRDDAAKQPLAGKEPLAQARAQSPLVLTELPTTGPLAADPAALADAWRRMPPPPGIVLDAGSERLEAVIAGWGK